MAGDALIAAAARPHTAVLIDGLFDRYPAIKHKELMHLMGADVRVIGGASMGALRAAELHAFGMIGVGRIFQAYARGRLVADDEVALLHGPAETDWAPLSVPLVNVRATLQRAVRLRILDAGAARTMLELACATFYQDRTWASVTDAAAARVDVARFREWVCDGYVDLKQQDALACVAVALVPSGARPAISPPETAFTRRLTQQLANGLKPDLAPAGIR